MTFNNYRQLVLALCIGLLLHQPEKVQGQRSHSLVQRLAKAPIFFKKHAEDLNTSKKSADLPSSPDPNSVSKRSVRRGSDPIHNRS